MSRRVVCRKCNTEFAIRGELTSNRVRCPGCQVIIRLSPTPPPSDLDEQGAQDEAPITRNRTPRRDSRSEASVLPYWILAAAAVAAAIFLVVYAIQTLSKKPEIVDRNANALVESTEEEGASPRNDRSSDSKSKPKAPAGPQRKFLPYESLIGRFRIEFPEQGTADDLKNPEWIQARRNFADGSGFEAISAPLPPSQQNSSAEDLRTYVRGYVRGQGLKLNWQFDEPPADFDLRGRPSVSADVSDGKIHRKIIAMSASGRIFLLSVLHPLDKPFPADSQKFFDSFQAL